MKRPALIILGLLLTLSAAGTVFYLRRPEPPPQLETAAVSRMDLEETVLATGTINAFKTVEVGAQVSGQLEKLHVDLGDRVEKGILLAEIDPILQQNSLKEATAELDNINAQIVSKQALLEQYQKAYDRQMKMIEHQATSTAELESARAQLDSTRADLEALDAQLRKARISVDTAQANLGYTRISAPISGVVISIDSEEGQTLVSSQTVSTILTLANVDKMTVKAEISEADVTKVAPGMAVYFTILGEPDNKRHATLRAIEPGPVEDATSSSSSSAIYYNGLFDVDNRDHRLRVGMTAEVTIVLARATNVLAAPVAVLRNTRSSGTATVDVVRDDQPQPVEVLLGLNDKVHVELKDGVAEGDQLVIHQLSIAQDEENTSRRRMRPPGAMR
nr:efflux RND transporter periplasmic adaptor subunit [uncultured Desulfuromonas sp.]